jgi:integrase/recombinase XerD
VSLSTVVPRTLYEYQRVLHLGLDADNQITPAVAAWSRGRKIVFMAALRWAVSNGLLAEERRALIKAAVELPKKSVRRVLAPSEDGAAAFEAAAKALPEPHRSMVLLLLYVGLRGSELLWLPRESVERAAEDGMLLVMRKGNKQTMLPLPREYRALFVSLLETQWATVGDLVAPDRAHVTRLHMIEKLVHRVAASASMKAHPHLLRHICANRMHAKGATVLEVKEWLGHENINTTMMYLNADLKHAARFLESAATSR